MPAHSPHGGVAGRFAKAAVAGTVFPPAIRLDFCDPQYNTITAKQFAKQILGYHFNRAKVKTLSYYGAMPTYYIHANEKLF
jgi:hypothetical protein